jgi:hypothetical protein
VYEPWRVEVVRQHRDPRASSPVSSPRRGSSIRSILDDSDDDDISQLQAHMLMRALGARQFHGGWGGPAYGFGGPAFGFGGPAFGFGGFGGGGFFLG